MDAALKIKKALEIDLKQIRIKLTTFIKENVEKTNAKGVVIGLSGGLDSSTTVTLCVEAFGAGRVLGVSMPEAGVTDPQDIQWMKPRLTPMPILTHQEKLDAPKMKAKKLPRFFVHCTQFGLGEFAEKIRREGGTVFDLDTGHDAMITEPERLSAILDKIVSTSEVPRTHVL